jgi:hypothetical protein
MPDERQKTRERDTSSLITTGARNLTVLDDNDEYAGAAQTFGQDRATEMAAIENTLNPQPDDTTPFDFDELVDDMKSRGYVWCNGRCQNFKHKSEFSTDDRNPGRLGCQSYCKECMAARDRRKRVALLPRDVQAQQRYEYRARKKKRKG